MNFPCQNMEIEQIYSQILTTGVASLAICSANSGEGVTSLLVTLAQHSLLAGRSTLIVDLNLYRPAFKSILPLPEITNSSSELTTINSTFTVPQLVTIPNTGIIITGITAPHGREHINKLRQPGVLEQCIKEWQSQYDIVLIDTPPINRINAQNIPAQRISAACDGTLLMVLAGQTSEEMISLAMHKLKASDAYLVGCIYNDCHNASLKNELLRQLQRFDRHFGRLLSPIKNLINNNETLKLEI